MQRVRDWLRSESTATTLPSGAVVHGRYLEFLRDLRELCVKLRFDIDSLTFADFSDTIIAWLARHR